MHLRHVPADGDPRPLATEVALADSLLAQARGLMFRRSVPDDYALVFRFGRSRTRGLHMLFVPFDVDAVFLADGEVTAVERMRAWVGGGRGHGDVVVELPAGGADGVTVGDRVELVGE